MKSTFTIIALCIIFAIPANDGALGAQSSTTKHRHKKSVHQKKQHAALTRPAVIDTSCIDTTNVVHQLMIKEINRWSSVRYKKGGITLRGADCSGFVLNVYKNSVTLDLPRTSREQATIGEEVEKDSLRFGDLIFFYKNMHKKIKRIGHVGIYIGDGNFVHSSKHKGVGVDALTEHYYASHFARARRIADLTPGRLEEIESIRADE